MNSQPPALSQFVSKETFYKMCHIRKSKALHLIQEGLIPAIDTKKKTKRYLIAQADIDFYLRDRIENPLKYGCLQHGRVQTYEQFQEWSPTLGEKISKFAELEWQGQPDLLTCYDVTNLLGYRKGTIQKWWNCKDIIALAVSGTLYIPKKSLLNFLKTSQLYSVPKKPLQHIDLIRRATCEG